MTVAEKIRYLRVVEGQLRGLGREMTQKEVIAAIEKDLNRSLSQPYLSQLESGRRKHMTNTSRLLLAKFFKVHPGYLVDDPEGFQTELLTDLQQQEDKLDLWLIQGAERFRSDPALSEALLKLAKHNDTRKCVLLLGAILDTPNLVDRLSEVLVPAGANTLDSRDEIAGSVRDVAGRVLVPAGANTLDSRDEIGSSVCDVAGAVNRSPREGVLEREVQDDVA
ncbi:MAG TPA: transcriptional regulator [Bryobacteraceae bacterium]|nr:transcriptional regulator [Bryobacteraceae bacterium]